MVTSILRSAVPASSSCGAHRVLEFAVFLLSSIQDFQLLRFSEFAIAERVLALGPNLDHCAQFWLLHLLWDLLWSESVQHSLLQQSHLVQCILL